MMLTRHLFFALFLCSAVAAFSQPSITTQQDAGGSQDDRLYAMSLTPDGGYITGGWSVSNVSGNKTQNDRGNEDYWIVKFSKARKIQWDKTFGGNYLDQVRAIKPTKDGGYIVGGTSGSGIAGDKTVASKGGFDFWILKLDSAGNIQWQKDIGGGDDDYLNDLQLTPDGGYVVGGSSQSNISGDKTENSRGDADYWVVKLDTAGNIQWQKTIGGSNYDDVAGVQPTKDGGYIVGGTSGSGISGDKTAADKGADDYWVVKLNSTGAIQWQTTIGGSGEDAMGAIQQTTDGNYIVGGYSASGISGDKSEINRGVYDYWVIKINSTGAILWQKTIGGTNDDELTSLQQTSDGGYVVNGFSSSNASYEKTENSRGYYDYWVVKLDGSGGFIWNKTIGGSSSDYAYSIKEIKPNNYNVAGFSSSGISGDKKLASKGANDFWIAQLKYVPTASGSAALIANTNKTIPLTKATSFTVYPNPARDILHVETSDAATFIISDETGRQVITQKISGKADITVSRLAAGIYYLKNAMNNETKKIVITK